MPDINPLRLNPVVLPARMLDTNPLGSNPVVPPLQGRPRRSSTLNTAKPLGRSFSPRTNIRRRPTIEIPIEESLMPLVKATPGRTPPRKTTPLPRLPTFQTSSPIQLETTSPYDTIIRSSPPELMYSPTLSSPFDDSVTPITPTPKPRQRPTSCPLPQLMEQQSQGLRHGGGMSLSSTISSHSGVSLDWPEGFHRRQPHPNQLPERKSTTPRPNRIDLVPRDSHYALVPNIRHPHWTTPETYSPNHRRAQSSLSGSSDDIANDSSALVKNKKKAPTGPKEIVYDLTSKTFRYEYRSILIPPNNYYPGIPLAEYPENQPPMHCDGRMTIVTIPKWKREMRVYERILVKNKKNVRTGSVASESSTIYSDVEASNTPRLGMRESPRPDPYVSKVKSRTVKLPLNVWVKRNLGLGAGGFELKKVEDGVQLKWKKGGNKFNELFVERV